MFAMDSSSMSLLGFGAIVVVGAVIMYLVSLLSMKETSFEDVLEEQRKKKAKEDKERSLQNKQKREQYKKKFDQKKRKTNIGNGKVEKDYQAVADDHSKEVADSSDATPTSTPEIRKKPAAKPAKKQAEPAAAQHKQDSPKPSHPILKPSSEKAKEEIKQKAKEESRQSKNTAAAKAETQNSGRARTVSFNDDVQESQKSEVEHEKTKKKKKKEPEVDSEFIGQLKEISLSDRDVQSALTVLKQKYGVDVGGGAKIKELQHLLESAKKQLGEQEGNLKNYVNRCMGAENKIEQLKQDILLEKTKATSFQRAVEDAEAKRQAEVSGLVGKHASEMKQLHEKIAMAKDYEEMKKKLASATTQNSVLMEEVKKNATVISENQRLSTDLKLAKTKLQEVQKKCTEVEQQLEGANKNTDSMQQQQGEKEKHFLHQLQEQANNLQLMEQSRNKANSELERVNSELMTTQRDSTKLLEQITNLNSEMETKSAALSDLEKRLADRDAKIEKMTKQNTDLTAQVKNLEQQVSQLNSQIVKVEQETKSKSSADEKTNTELLESVKKEKSDLKNEVDRLKKKNNDLRDRSWKAMDALALMEKSIPEKVNAAKAEGDTLRANLESSVKKSLSNAFPSISIAEKIFDNWVEAFVKKASEVSQTVQSTQESSAELEEARDEVQKLRNKLEKSSGETSDLKKKLSNLEASVENMRKENEDQRKSSAQHDQNYSNAVAECEKYKSVLESTEEVLRKLQASVELEEAAWQKKVEEANAKASQATSETSDLKKSVENLKSEKSALEKEVNESSELKKRLEEMTVEVSDLKAQLEVAKAAVTDSLQQTEDERLDKEKSLTKNLGQAATKLQNVLKQTQEQLKDEKDKNAELEKQLANGDSAQN